MHVSKYVSPHLPVVPGCPGQTSAQVHFEVAPSEQLLPQAGCDERGFPKKQVAMDKIRESKS